VLEAEPEAVRLLAMKCFFLLRRLLWRGAVLQLGSNDLLAVEPSQLNPAL
jgi:hypothetical protein